MRASRLADQTSKLVSALANRAAATQSSNTAGSPSSGGEAILAPHSSKQVTRGSDGGLEHIHPAPSPLKRKRGSNVVTIKKESDETLTSPRGALISDGVIPKRATRQPAKKVKIDDGAVVVEPPPNWEEVYLTTKEMRMKVLAPVDTMGCENLAEDQRSPRDKRFQTLLALMLSSQTKDTVTAVAMRNMQDNMPGGLTLESILRIEPELLNSLISKVGFHNNKTKFIKATAEILRDKHDSDIPDTIEGLVALPGVGPKMAYLCMSAAWGRDEGIGVDVHVHRITNLWGWHKTSTPEETRATLERWLPKEKWHDINHLLVGFGQTWCPPVGRKCDECFLSAKSLCPSATIGKITKQKSQRIKTVVKDDEGDHAVKTEIGLQLDQIPIKAEELPAAIVSDAKSPIQDIEDIGRTRKSARLAHAAH